MDFSRSQFEWLWNVERPLPVFIAWDGRTWAWRKAEHPPLVLTAWGGRTWAWYRVERPLPVLTAWVVRKIERPPLILTVLGGRTRAHLDNSSQASSPYLNCVGWQDKPTVEQLLCRWCLMLHFLAVTIRTPPPSSQFAILMLAVKYHLLTLYPRHHTFLILSNWPRFCTALSWWLGQ